MGQFMSNVFFFCGNYLNVSTANIFVSFQDIPIQEDRTWSWPELVANMAAE